MSCHLHCSVSVVVCMCEVLTCLLHLPADCLPVRALACTLAMLHLQDFPIDEADVSQRKFCALTRVLQDLHKIHKEGQSKIMCVREVKLVVVQCCHINNVSVGELSHPTIVCSAAKLLTKVPFCRSYQ